MQGEDYFQTASIHSKEESGEMQTGVVWKGDWKV